MPQENNKTRTEKSRSDATRPRNEAVPGHNANPTSEKLDEKNSPEVRDALNETQL